MTGPEFDWSDQDQDEDEFKRRPPTLAPERCPVCNGELRVDDGGRVIPHDHLDDSPEIPDNVRADRRDPYGMGDP